MLLAPELIVPELLNVRWKVARTGGFVPDVSAIMDLLARLTLEPMTEYATDAAAFAERLDHPVYDCFYVALAHRWNGIIITADHRLRRKLTANSLDHLVA